MKEMNHYTDREQIKDGALRCNHYTDREQIKDGALRTLSCLPLRTSTIVVTSVITLNCVETVFS
jgi:hypothetical protein